MVDLTTGRIIALKKGALRTTLIGNTMNKKSNELIQKILVKLVAEYSPKKVILFGSYAYGNPGPDSDLDLLIIKDTTDRFIDRWVMVQGILTGTHPSFPVETLVLTPREITKRLDVGDQFIEEILKKGDVLYAA